MSENEWLASRFELDRPRLRAVAFRVLGSMPEADDAVQETWLRIARSDASAVENMSGWLTTIVARVSLNMLQSRNSRREDLSDAVDEEGAEGRELDPEQEAMLADSVGAAMLVILDTLSPAERLAFVLHDMFAVPFDEIAPIVSRSPAAARQLASRARRRIQRQGADGDEPGGGDAGVPAGGAGDGAGAVVTPLEGVEAEKAEFIRAFLAASREGDFEALLATLAPDIVVRTDEQAVRVGVTTGMGVAEEIRGADAVTRAFARLTWAPVPALIDGQAGLAYVHDGVPRVVFRFAFSGGLISGIDIQADLAGLDVVVC
ncbi:sigma-70 family RNA polymerase sigma factor [Streptomyces sp. NPDC020917]|uniref:sigma-70 family RNA polymerase sigma factor n=1 Tax=Streptomyces sp. NPDC020917 TaxID=3365102 RepID=UPI0037BA2D02